MVAKSAGIGFSGASGSGAHPPPFATRGSTTTLAIFSSSANRDQYYTGNPGDLVNTRLGAGLEAVGVSTTAPSADGLTVAYVRNSTNTDWIPVASNYIGPQGPKGDQGANVINLYRNGSQVGDSLQAVSLDFVGAGVSVTGNGTAKAVTIPRLAVRDDESTIGAAATIVFSGFGVRVTGTGSTKVVEMQPPVGGLLTFALVADTGDANNIAVQVDRGVTALTGNLAICFRVRLANTGACTLSVNGLDAYPLRAGNSLDLRGGELAPFVSYIAIWTGVDFKLLGTPGMPINLRPAKSTLSNNDFLLIEDSEDGFKKKRISVATLVAHLTGGT